ncbi:MAG: glycoside hydrolase family protein [Verrucomicrobia bacterium]|jgi:GH18 family chitinase|nr:glycoside hydrolase family protein [Verrucomicrobiota bacterium]
MTFNTLYAWRKALAALGVFMFSLIAHAESRVVAYVPNWVDLNTFSETIEYGKITHINIAFENPKDEEGNLSFNNRNEVLIKKAKENKVKVLISIGGGAASGNKALLARYFDLISDAKRAAFTAKLADYVEAHGFDGLDVDIEGPAINHDYGAFIENLAKVLKPKDKLRTCALSKGYGGNKVKDETLTHFDFVNIMAYDGAGAWNPNAPGQHSSMEFAKSNVKFWLDKGLPKSKAVLGVPFYGYGFGEAFRKSSYAYYDILQKYPGAEKVDKIGSTIWYNGIPTIKAKTQYVVDEGLGGIMIWSLDNDVKRENSLLSAIHETLKAKKAAKVEARKP